MQKIIILFFVFFISACFKPAISVKDTQAPGRVDSATKKVTLAPGVVFRLLPPASFGKNVSLSQTAEIAFNGEQHELVFQTEISAEKLVVVGLRPDGMRLFTIVYDGKSISTDGVGKAIDNIKPLYLLADMQLSLWPVEVLRKELENNSDCFRSGVCSLLSGSNPGLFPFSRQLLNDDKVVISIQYKGQPGYSHGLNYHHLLRNYKLVISPFAVESL